MPHVAPAPPDPDCTAALPGCDFADAFSVVVTRQDIDPGAAMKLAFGTPPGWVNTLMATRNAVMGRLGYKAPRIQRGFPVLRAAPGMELSGLDDAHLDFRALVRVTPEGDGRSRITLTTAVRTHNRLGRVYLAVILPFHRVIVRNLLARMARQLEAAA
ncbi:DUF2867 domain-containing protein [Ferrovibrio xuzhouensis]|uniref:DUF2867 domain-containing protein n=1 Tax=Ferrovibrio xuzhouensis TaxID=1576914 RepID=A0ABV7VD39_9PROT